MYKVEKTFRLTDLISEDNIVSVVETSSFYGRSLAIAYRGESRVITDDYQSIAFRAYGVLENRKTIFISLDRFTYTIPHSAALPRELYKYVKIMLKNDLEHNIKFIKCSVTKKVEW